MWRSGSKMGGRSWRGGIFLILALGCGKTVALGRGNANQVGGGAGLGGVAAAGSAAASGGTGGSTELGAGGDPQAAGGADAGAGGVSSEVAISGTVVALDESPAAGIALEVQGRSLTTAEDGSFTAFVTPPYDIVLREAQTAETSVYLGVTRSDPKLYTYVVPEFTAPIKGRVTGGSPFPQPASSYTRVYALAPVFGEIELPLGESGAYDTSLNPTYAPWWSGAPTTQALLLAAQVDNLGQTPAERLTGIGVKAITLASGVTVQSPEADVALTPPTFREFELEVTLPDGAEPEYCDAGVTLAGIDWYRDFGCAALGAPIEVPDLADVELQLTSAGSLGDRTYQVSRRIAAGATSARLEIPATFPVVESPALEASGKASSLVFRIIPVAGAVTLLKYCYDDTPYVPCTSVFTDDSNVALTRLLELGVDFPAGEDITWQVFGREAASVDEHLAPSREPRASSLYLFGNPTSEGARSFSYEPD